MDIDSLPIGVDFVEQVELAVAGADIALVLIGPNWLNAADETGARRLDDPEDFVRIEVATVLRSSSVVIPVLIDGAQMPKRDQLPEDLRPLTRRQALTFQRQGRAAIQQILTAIDRVTREREARLAAEAEEQARREAEEQARREAEEQARREAEEQARREAEEQARREAEEQARREAEEQARREAEERARREAQQQAAPGELDVVAEKAMAKEPGDSHDSAGDVGAAAIVGARSRVHAEPPERVAAVPAPQNTERERVETGRTAPRERPSKEVLQARPRSYRLSLRAWILVLAAGALAAVLVALLIPGSQQESPSTSTGGASGAVTARWTPLSQPLPKPVQAAGVAWYQGRLWVVGGTQRTQNSKNDPVADVYAYNPRLQKWLTGTDGVPQLPEPRAHAAVVSTGRSLYVIGGYGSDGVAVPTVFRLDGPNGQWLAHPREQLLEARKKGAAAWDGAQIIFAGGNQEQPGKDDVWALKPGGQWKPIGKLHQDREDLAAATDGIGTVWFVGGKNTPHPPTASPLVDVVRSNKVTSLPDVSPITGAAAIGVGSGFCTIGGTTTSGPNTHSLTDQVRCHGTQARFPALSTPTAYLGATITSHTVYVVGGYTATDTAGTRTAEKLDIDGG